MTTGSGNGKSPSTSWLDHVEWGRKALHAGSALLALWILFVEPPISLIALVTLMLYIITVDVARIKLHGWASWFNHTFPFVFRHEEENRLSGATMMMVGITLTALLFDERVAAVGILCLALGDSSAAIAGQSATYFRNRGQARADGEAVVKRRARKTVYGSLACLIVSALMAGILVGFDPYVYLPAGVVATIMERWTPGQWDNLSIPLVTASVVELALSWPHLY
jgi:dolichol kinase